MPLWLWGIFDWTPRLHEAGNSDQAQGKGSYWHVGTQGWVETTYVDDEVRVGRGDKGSVFVTVRQREK